MNSEKEIVEMYEEAQITVEKQNKEIDPLIYEGGACQHENSQEATEETNMEIDP
ncbi:hypothetical protein RHMOL_Rhmol03G0145200 [Rhododendron molle]|uniref:Uncharacterized protein n=1 Tax=Rhododendron molle TaxID=49168 RepID=A0ACC0PFH0_RHOML|nr:hypothetical protein RHMOL_Rhmol03G0145200 [Rhododendron molle]